jgi:hypothetical protein
MRPIGYLVPWLIGLVLIGLTVWQAALALQVTAQAWLWALAGVGRRAQVLAGVFAHQPGSRI